MTGDPDRESTWHVTATASPLPTGSRLVVFGDGILASHPLPAKGRCVIGRATDADIHIDHRKVSRRHVALDVGPPLAVEDLGSQNGTRVRGVRLPPSARSIVGIGDPVSIGPITLLVQAALASDTEIEDRFVRETFLVERLERHDHAVLVVLRADDVVPLDLVDHAVATATRGTVLACRLGPREFVLAELEGHEEALDDVVTRATAQLAALGGRVRTARAKSNALAATRRAIAGEAPPAFEAAEQQAILATNMAVALVAQERREEAAAEIARVEALLGNAQTTTAATCFAMLASASEAHEREEEAARLYACAIAIETALGHERSARMLEARVAALGVRTGSAQVSLVVDHAKRSFRLGKTDVELGRRRTLWALFEAICERRVEAPGHAVTRDELLERAWPGERMLAEAAQNRLYVAIAELRRMGLRDVLVHRGEGYAIAESIEVIIAPRRA